MTQYIHVVNWDKFQRFGDRRVSWVRVYTDLHRENAWLDLTGHQRAVLLGIWIEYAMNVRQDADGQYADARGIELTEKSPRPDSRVTSTSPPSHLNVTTTSLSRRLNLRVMTRDLESLNQAGFIWFSEHEPRHKATPDESLDTQILRYSETTLSTDVLEQQSLEIERAGSEAFRDDVLKAVEYGLAADVESDPDADIPLLAAPSNGRHLELVPVTATPNINARPRDDIWDLLEIKFGPVGAKGSNAHAKRNKACADLKRAGATVELVRAACDRWPAVFASATLTDAALATHYPLLAVPLLAKAARPAPCAECELGGGAHAAGCSRAVA